MLSPDDCQDKQRGEFSPSEMDLDWGTHLTAPLDRNWSISHPIISLLDLNRLTGKYVDDYGSRSINYTDIDYNVYTDGAMYALIF